MKLYKLKIACTGIVLAAVAAGHADSWAYSEAGVFTSFSAIGPDLEISVQNSNFNEYYNDNDPPSFGIYTNSPSDSSSPNNVLNPNIITASVESTATEYAYTGWLNENESVYGIYNAGSVAESVTVSATCYALGNDGISGSGGSALFNSTGVLVADFGSGWNVSASLNSSQFSSYGLEQTSSNGSLTVSVNPNQTLAFVAYDYDITEAYSNATPEPFAPGLLALSCVGLIARRRKLRMKS